MSWIDLGGFYQQNIFHINDGTNILNNILKLLEAFVRTRLIESENSTRNCFDDGNYQLEQIHLIYEKSIFQGYSFEYQFSHDEHYQVFLRLNLLQANLSASLKRFEVNRDVH